MDSKGEPIPGPSGLQRPLQRKRTLADLSMACEIAEIGNRHPVMSTRYDDASSTPAVTSAAPRPTILERRLTTPPCTSTSSQVITASTSSHLSTVRSAPPYRGPLLDVYPPGITEKIIPLECIYTINGAKYLDQPRIPSYCLISAKSFPERRGRQILEQLKLSPTWQYEQDPLVAITRSLRGFPHQASNYLQCWLSERYATDLYLQPEAYMYIQFHANLILMYASYYDYKNYFILSRRQPTPSSDNAFEQQTYASLFHGLNVTFKHYKWHLREVIDLMCSIKHRQLDIETEALHLSLNIQKFLFHK